MGTVSKIFIFCFSWLAENKKTSDVLNHIVQKENTLEPCVLESFNVTREGRARSRGPEYKRKTCQLPC